MDGAHLYCYSRQCSAYTHDFLPRFDLKGDPSEHRFLPLSWVTEVSILEDDVTFKLLGLQLRCDAMRAVEGISKHSNGTKDGKETAAQQRKAARKRGQNAAGHLIVARLLLLV